MHSSKMPLTVPILASVLLCFTILISGNAIPATFPGRWIPTQDRPPETLSTGSVQSYSAYHQPFSNSNVRLKSAQYGSAIIKKHQQRHQEIGEDVPLKTSNIEHTELDILPEPKPRREDVFQEKLGFGILSSLLPTSILSASQQNQDGENQIDADSNYGPAQENKGQQQFSSLIQQQIGQDNNNAGIAMQYNEGSLSYTPEQFSSNSENSQEEDSGNGLFSRIRNAIPFGKGLLSGLLNNENSNSDDEETMDGQYGYADSSSSFKTPALSNSFFRGQPNLTSLFAFNPAQISLPSNQVDGNSGSYANEPAESGGSFLPSLLPNPIESIKNLLSSFGTSSDENYEQDQPEYGGGASLFPNSSQISLANPQDSSPETSKPTEPENNYFSSFSNPIDTLRNLLSTIGISSPIQNEQQPSESEGGYVNDPNVLDSALTPLQSLLADDGFNGALGVVVPYLSQFFKAFGLVKAKLPFVKLLGAALGPILAAAIAAMVIGIVYVSIYISASIAQNEDVEGEVFILSIKQLLDILGIPDTLEDLFDFIAGRSLQERSSKSLASAPGHDLNITNENYKCIERIACNVVGKTLANVKPSWKKGWFGKGIKWISGNLNLEDWDMIRMKSSSYFNYAQSGKSIIDAIATGMEPHVQDDNGKNNTNITNSSNISVCAKYACDPTMFLKKLF